MASMFKYLRKASIPERVLMRQARTRFTQDVVARRAALAQQLARVSPGGGHSDDADAWIQLAR